MIKTLRCSEKRCRELTSKRNKNVADEERLYGNTCQHALIDDTRPVGEHGVAGHDHPIGWNYDDITGHKLCGHGLFDI